MRPTRRGLWNKTKALFDDENSTIKSEDAEDAIKQLRKYGIISQAKTQLKTHRVIQRIVRDLVEKKPDVKLQTLQLLETMFRKLSNNENFKAYYLDMLSHLYSLLKYIQSDIKIRNKLLNLQDKLINLLRKCNKITWII
ncbi:MAG: hypothetical protein GY830_05055 [Bacteroidetes bacterium]|nr:hypothetical protein [Bacteroidota bacterium]